LEFSGDGSFGRKEGLFDRRDGNGFSEEVSFGRKAGLVASGDGNEFSGDVFFLRKAESFRRESVFLPVWGADGAARRPYRIAAGWKLVWTRIFSGA
jgi:hypothetical protein